jgi:integrase/recombinase XerD
MTAADLTFLDLAERLREAIRDRSYQQSRLGASIAAYLAWKKPSASARTLEIIEGYLAALCVRLVTDHGDLGLEDVTAQMLMQAAEQHPPGSYRLVRSSYLGLFEWATDWEELPRNPARRLPKARKPGQKVYEIFTGAEQAKLLAACDRLPLPWVQRLRVLCLLDLGVRKDEARGLRGADFDTVAKCVVVLGKGGKERVVQFSDELWRALVTFRNRPIPNVRTDGYLEPRQPLDSDYLFFPYGANGDLRVTWADPFRQMSARGMHSWWAKVVAEAGVEYRSMHMARHTLATELATADTDALAIRDWLGHASVSTTQVYVHNSRSRLTAARAKLDDFRKARGA